jgi:hypothetical protein
VTLSNPNGVLPPIVVSVLDPDDPDLNVTFKGLLKNQSWPSRVNRFSHDIDRSYGYAVLVEPSPYGCGWTVSPVSVSLAARNWLNYSIIVPLRWRIELFCKWIKRHWCISFLRHPTRTWIEIARVLLALTALGVNLLAILYDGRTNSTDSKIELDCLPRVM